MFNQGKRVLPTLWLPLLVVFLLFYSVSATGQAGLEEELKPAAAGAASETILLPLINSNACYSSYPSQFSLQIAALHLIPPQPTVQDKDGYTSLTAALKDSGAAWTRLYIKWSEIEPVEPLPGQNPVYEWEWYDTRILPVVNVGVTPILTIAMNPGWASAYPCSAIDDAKVPHFIRFVTDIVNRYKQPPYNIHYWELFNEPDGVKTDSWLYGWGCWGNNGAKYAAMLSQAYTAIKTADPTATVLLGGLAYDNFIEYEQSYSNFNRYFIDDVIEAGGAPFMDALNIHYFPDFHREWERWDPLSDDRLYLGQGAPTCGPVNDGEGIEYYAGGIDVIAKVSHLQNRMQTCYGVYKPVWITELAEIGIPNDAASLTNQARYVITGHVRALAAGVTNVTWYALHTRDGYEQGLLDSNWVPKPGFYAYQTLTSQLTGFRYARSAVTRDGDRNVIVEAYTFANPCGREKTAAWGTGILNLWPAARADVVDRTGSKTVITDGGAGDSDGLVNGTIALQLTAEPVFIEFYTR